MSDEDIRKLLAGVAAAEEADAAEERQHYRSRRPAKSPSQVYSIRIPVKRLEEIRRLASEAGIAPTVMIRNWVLERLDAEAAERPALRRMPGAGRQGIRMRVDGMPMPAIHVDLGADERVRKPNVHLYRELTRRELVS